jgi:hypothetical protein
MVDGPNKNFPFYPPADGVVRTDGVLSPDYLPFGQNLYAQEPFGSAIARLQETLGLSEERDLNLLRRVFTSTLSIPHVPELIYEWQQGLSPQAVVERYVLIDSDIGSLAQDKTPFPRIARRGKTKVASVVARELFVLLTENPLIGEYVASQTQSRELFDKGGRSTVKSKQAYGACLPISYARWLRDQRQREKRIAFLGAELNLRRAFSNRELPLLPPGVVQGKISPRRKTGTRIT